MIDGPDGVGKTTQIRRVANELRHRGYRVYQARMNGGTEIGEALREVILTNYDRPVATDFFILQAITAALIDELPKHKSEHDVVLIDRSPVSLLAYQVYAGGFPPNIAYPAVESALQSIDPDIVICLTASAETLIKHKMQRDNTDHFERQSLDFHQKVIDGYAAAEEHVQVTIVDAEGSEDEVFARILQNIEPLLLSLHT